MTRQEEKEANPPCFGQLGCPLNDIEDLFTQFTNDSLEPAFTASDLFSSMLPLNQYSPIASSSPSPADIPCFPDYSIGNAIYNPAIDFNSSQVYSPGDSIVVIPQSNTNDLALINQMYINMMLTSPFASSPMNLAAPNNHTTPPILPNIPTQTTKKRKKVHQACAHCRRAHLSCQDERPCKRCIKKQIDCFDEPASITNSTQSSSSKRLLLYPKCKTCPVKIKAAAPLVVVGEDSGILKINTAATGGNDLFFPDSGQTNNSGTITQNPLYERKKKVRKNPLLIDSNDISLSPLTIKSPIPIPSNVSEKNVRKNPLLIDSNYISLSHLTINSPIPIPSNGSSSTRASSSKEGEPVDDPLHLPADLFGENFRKFINEEMKV